MKENNKNILLATVISMAILLAWTWFYEKPRIERREAQAKIDRELQQQIAAKDLQKNVATTSAASDIKARVSQSQAIIALKDRESSLKETAANRIKIESESLHGSIYLKGARFDDLTLAKYFETIENKKEVTLLAPSESKERYFADFGWISSDASLDLPNPESLWRSSSQKLTPQNPITLSWKNRQNVEFFIDISLDQNYMFNVTQRVINRSGKEIVVASYGRVNRVLNNVRKPVYILHEGPIGVFNGVLQESSYKDLSEEKLQNFEAKNGGWLGITDKYWLSSIIPDKTIEYKADFSTNISNQNQFFNAEFIGQEHKIAANDQLKFEHHLFAGAKQVKLLDQYAKDYDIKLFDRAVDFGWFYFITKPFFFLIDFLNKILGNFGLAILAMTVLVKAVLFPMANKSYAAIAKMKKLQPEMEEIRKKFKDDKLALNREIMELYKKKKINPASGCLPILIQIPIFFSLYKVIYVTLDMRQAPFYGWIQDLSAPDPTSIFNLFGLLPFEPSGFLILGLWPIMMGITMILQQKLSPPVADPTQAKILKYIPYVLTFVLASFPAGLVIYWTWNNLLSIAQQMLMMRKVDKKRMFKGEEY